MVNLNFYKDKNVFITGHTGFKGSWLCEVLLHAGASITGYALKPPTDPSLFELLNLDKKINSHIGDIADLEKLTNCMKEAQPEIVIHMAAQPLVRESYDDPVGTYRSNVMGTVNVLEAVRQCPSVKSVVNVTTDKVYHNIEQNIGYVETDELNGYDPYSNSKSCSELVTSSYKLSFLNEAGVAVSTCRAGNVIGGGDFAKDRIIPDSVRAAIKGEEIIVRNPNSIRPYQHVLEPLFAYLMVAQKQYENFDLGDCYNIGPDDKDCKHTSEIVTCFCNAWNAENGSNLTWKSLSDGGPHEAGLLKLDCTKLKNTFGWQPVWSTEIAIDKIAKWSTVYNNSGYIEDITIQQIAEFIQDCS